MKRRFRHATRIGEFREIADEGGQVVVYFSTDWLGENRKRNEAKTGTFEQEVALAGERGFTIEVDEKGAPLKPPTSLDRARLLAEKLEADPYNTFVALRALLPEMSKPGPVLKNLLRALELIEADVDEHELQNYRVYFPAGDGLEALTAYREHYQRLVKQVSKGVKPSAAHLRYEFVGAAKR